MTAAPAMPLHQSCSADPAQRKIHAHWRIPYTSRNTPRKHQPGNEQAVLCTVWTNGTLHVPTHARLSLDQNTERERQALLLTRRVGGKGGGGGRGEGEKRGGRRQHRGVTVPSGMSGA